MICVMCNGALLPMAMGSCSRCRGLTHSYACQLCTKCSEKTGDCENCGKPAERELTNEEKAVLENRERNMLEVLARIAERRAKRAKVKD